MITDSVGEKGRNYPLDVARVQKLINQNLHFLRNQKPLVVDGIAGSETIDAIIEYQKSILKVKVATGCIEPNRTTIKWLMKTARKPRPQNIDTFIIKALPAARKIKTKYQIPVSVLIAEAGIESVWGQKIIKNTYFSARKVAESGRICSTIYDGDIFSCCDNFDEAAENFGRYLKTSPKFITAFSYRQQPLIFAKQLEENGYSKNIENGNGLCALIRKYYLSEYD